MTDGGRRASYVLAATVRLEATDPGLRIEPATVEVTLHRAASEPGAEGWLFFRDNCWRGEFSHPEHVASLLEDELGLPVETVAFRELRTTEGYLADLREAIAADLEAFNADDVDAVLRNYLGSSVHVVDRERL